MSKPNDMIDVIHIESGIKKQFSRYMVEETNILKSHGYRVLPKPVMPTIETEPEEETEEIVETKPAKRGPKPQAK